jgi:hypothetical protein
MAPTGYSSKSWRKGFAGLVMLRMRDDDRPKEIQQRLQLLSI